MIISYKFLTLRTIIYAKLIIKVILHKIYLNSIFQLIYKYNLIIKMDRKANLLSSLKKQVLHLKTQLDQI
jgi:hypothetical protein